MCTRCVRYFYLTFLACSTHYSRPATTSGNELHEKLRDFTIWLGINSRKGRSLFSRNIRKEEEEEEKERNERIDIFYYIEEKVKIFLLFLFCINRLTEESFHNNEHDYGFENLKAKGCNGDYSFSL